MSPTLRLLLAFGLAAVAAFLAADPVGLPPTVSAGLAALVAGGGAIGIMPPSWRQVGDGNRAVKGKKRATPDQWARAQDDSLTPPGRIHGGERGFVSTAVDASSSRKAAGPKGRYPRIPTGRGGDPDL